LLQVSARHSAISNLTLSSPHHQACAGARLPFVRCFFEALGQKGGWAAGVSSFDDVLAVGKRCSSATPASWADIEDCAR